MRSLGGLIVVGAVAALVSVAVRGDPSDAAPGLPTERLTIDDLDYRRVPAVESNLRRVEHELRRGHARLQPVEPLAVHRRACAAQCGGRVRHSAHARDGRRGRRSPGRRVTAATVRCVPRRRADRQPGRHRPDRRPVRRRRRADRQCRALVRRGRHRPRHDTRRRRGRPRRRAERVLRARRRRTRCGVHVGGPVRMAGDARRAPADRLGVEHVDHQPPLGRPDPLHRRSVRAVRRQSARRSVDRHAGAHGLPVPGSALVGAGRARSPGRRLRRHCGTSSRRPASASSHRGRRRSWCSARSAAPAAASATRSRRTMATSAVGTARTTPTTTTTPTGSSTFTTSSPPTTFTCPARTRTEPGRSRSTTAGLTGSSVARSTRPMRSCISRSANAGQVGTYDRPPLILAYSVPSTSTFVIERGARATEPADRIP